MAMAYLDEERGRQVDRGNGLGSARRLPELLAPAGTFAAAVAALAAGADAVYTGAGAFNARAGAHDLSEPELARVCALAHARGARVYVTLNVYVYEDEVSRALDLAGRVLGAGADALIVADAGLVAGLREHFPGVEIHLSTQAGVMSAEGMEAARDILGAARVCCGRELSVSEIASLSRAGIEVECFCHGAICICYAGACEFSWRMHGRSANRGDCTQPCRHHYDLVDGEGVLRAGLGEVVGKMALGRGRGAAPAGALPGDMLLCSRDFLSIRHLPQLVDAGVSSLKIEGRMKNPDYVYNVISTYRRALDALGRGEAFDADAAEAALARSFNRGFSVEYLEGRSGRALMSTERACNQGLEVGVVSALGHEEVEVTLARDVFCGDTLEIRFEPGEDAPADVPKRWPMVPCPADGRAGEALRVRCKRKVSLGARVAVVKSVREVDCAERAMRELEPGLDLARRARPRRTVPHVPMEKRLGPTCAGGAFDAMAAAGQGGPAVLPVIRCEEEARRAREAILAAPLATFAAFAFDMQDWDQDLAQELLPRLVLILDEVCRSEDIGRTRAQIAAAPRVIARNLAQIPLAVCAGTPFEVAAPINVTHAESARVFARAGAQRVWLSPELSMHERASVLRALGGEVPVGVSLLAPTRLMTTEHCLLTSEGSCAGDARGTGDACAACPRRREERFLVERDGARLPVRVDACGRTRIYELAPTCDPAQARELLALGVSCVARGLDVTGA